MGRSLFRILRPPESGKVHDSKSYNYVGPELFIYLHPNAAFAFITAWGNLD